MNELKDLIVAVPKLLDGLVAKGVSSLEYLKKLFKKPNDFNLKGLSLIPFVDDLDNLEALKEQGAIVSWDQLKKVVEEEVSISFSKINRPYIKRLIAGLEQLEKAWRQKKLLNVDLKNQLDEYALVALKEHFPEVINGFNEIPYPEIQERFKALREMEVEQWLSSSDDLDQGRREHWDELVKGRILDQWFNQSKEEHALYKPLIKCLRLLLVDQFKIGQLPEKFNVLNKEALCKMIYEKVNTKKGNHAFQYFVLAESKLLKEKYIHDREGLEKAVTEQIYQKWFGGEIKDPEVYQVIDKMGCSLLKHISFNQMGDLHSSLKKNAVDLLLKQFREDTLLPFAKVALLETIQPVLLSDKYMEDQKERILKEIHEAFKEGKLEDKALIALCSNCIRAPISLLKEKLEPQVSQGHSVKFFPNGENQTATSNESTKETFVSNTFQ